MSTDNRNNRNSNSNSNNRSDRNRSSERSSRYGYSDGMNPESGRKVVRKVENTRFYERENPERNMRRVGKTTSDFERERASYSGNNETSSQRGRSYDSSERYVSQSDDSIPEFKSFRRNHSSHSDSISNSERRNSTSERDGYTGSNSSSSERRRNNSVRNNEKSEHGVYKDVGKNTDIRQSSRNLYTESEVSDDDAAYEFDAVPEEKKAKNRVGISERLAQKRADKKKRADIIARSDDRSYRRRAVSKKRDRKIRSEQLIKASICILIIFVVLIVTLSKCNYEDPHSTAYVTSGSIEFVTDAKVSFIREEEVYTAPASGVLVSAVNEGDKVSAGTTVAYITTAEHTELVAQLQEVEDKIKTIQKLGSSSIGVMSNDIMAIDEEIEKLSKELASVMSSGQMDEYSNIENQINALFIKRNEIITNSQSESSYLSTLISERDLIKERMSIYTHPVTASSAGTVSFYIDGSEAAFTGYSRTLSENPNSDAVNVATVGTAGTAGSLIGNQVGEGSAVVKVVTSSDYYIAAVAEGNISVQSGKALSVKSKDRSFNTDIDVVSVSYSGGKTLIIGKTSKSLVSSLGARTIDADVITGQYEGMKVPLSSLTEFDAAGTTARLTLLRSNYVVYAYVTVLAKDAEYAIISGETTFSDAEIKDKDGNIIDIDKTKGVSVNDIYILKPENVKEGDLIS